MTTSRSAKQRKAASVAAGETEPANVAAAGQAALAPTAADAPGQASGGRGTQHYVTFHCGAEIFAADLAPVKEIIRVPDVVRVPLAPTALKGLANLRGNILPIISLRSLFGFEDLAHDEATRALVIDVGQPLGFVVDRVASVADVDTSHLADVGSIRTTVNSEVLSSLLRDVGGHAMVMVLDFAKLVEREFSQIAALTRASTHTDSALVLDQKQDEATDDELQLVSFVVEGQEYAFAIDEVQEIVHVPKEVIHVPYSEQHVLGVITLRSRLLPLVNLRAMFSLGARDLDEKSRIVVLTSGAESVGVIVDAVSEVLRVPKSAVDAVPSLLLREGNLAEISSICKLESGKRMVSIVTARQLFHHASIQEVLESMHESEQASAESAEEIDSAVEDDEQVVVFRLDKEEFGVPVASVQEIVRIPDQLIRVPRAPSFVEGVVNLRGTILPVIDLRSRLGLPALERCDTQRIMVFLIQGIRTGFIVDQVAEVLRLPKSAIELAPALSEEQSRVLSRMANLEKQKRMLQLIELDHLMQQSDLTALAAVSG
jgi:purine-binding chemotaxis protein CheW